MDMQRGSKGVRLTERREDNIRAEWLVLSKDKYREGRAGHEERRRVPGKVGEGLSCPNLPQVLQFLLVPHKVELVHESRSPSVQLDALHVVDDFSNQLAAGVLVLHLRLLQVPHLL